MNYVGGFIGFVQALANVTIFNCTFNGFVIGTQTTGCVLGYVN